ncbi:DMT family transporter [Amylibacter sp. SFDW26]|uniref:DMT family transporter n=1 Tax=Amylibacter sp. SFDW26 TaxID=2652722 RepID=UPI0012619884|nr:DMT family transporter [Amylibacter sp. SFDW26]KAB7613756.1 DMT family transporter [Amylibacter sp. SFDW26]
MNRYTGPLLIFIAAVSWSTAGLFTRVVTTDIPTTLFWRSLFGGLCVLLIVLFYNRKITVKSMFHFSLGEVVIASLSTAGMICFISAFFYTSIANVSFVYGIMPLVTYILAVLFLKERINSLAVCCCILSAIGMSLMTFGSSNLEDYIGILLALGMTIFMAALTVAAKFFPNADSSKATYLSAFLGALIVLPFATFTNIAVNDYYWLALYGLINVGLGFGIYLLGVMRVTALTAALIGLLEIPLAPIWASLLFNEQVGFLTISGGILILISAIFYLIRSKT